jgi:single-stranded-DNA-specific exonuclease
VREWAEPPDVDVSDDLLAAVGGHPLVAKTLARRGYVSVEAARAFLDPDHYTPAPASDLPYLGQAVDRLEEAIRIGEKVCVWGDFDVDGQTATTILVSTLRDLGADVMYHIPVREKESHGLNTPVLEHLVEEGVRLVLTCDTGVSAYEEILYAQGQGVDVIVTDHHDLPSRVPEALAVVNPKMLALDHPLRELPGVGCAYKVAEALYGRAGRTEAAWQHLDLVALGIVADVAVQKGDTRYLLQRGLEALRHTRRMGLQVMMEMAEVDPGWLTEEHIGFVLGPRLNALGRLSDANPAVELLTTDDLARARVLATELEGLNAHRKLLCDQVLQAAQAQIERDRSLLDYGALVLSHPAWPAGVIGIVAGRLAEQYGRPTVLISAPAGGLARGSARSVEGCNITAAIAAQAEMLDSFGGHPMAAGLAIDRERIPDFRRALSHTIEEMLGDVGQQRALQIAGYVPLGALSLDLVEELERLAPFGPGNPPLTLASRDLVLRSHSFLGRNEEHLQLIVEDEEGLAQRVIWWQGAGWPLPEGRFDLAYVVRASDRPGQRDIQVEFVDTRLVEGADAGIRVPSRALEVIDQRMASNSPGMLVHLREEEGVQVWAEAMARAEVEGQDRYELRPAKTLVIWTTPPGPVELREAVDRVSPERLHVFAIDPGLDDAERFLRRLAGLISRALRANDGLVKVTTLAAATAQRETTVRAGIAWLAAAGRIVVRSEEGDELRLAAGMEQREASLTDAAAHLKALLEETAAYRAHFRRAGKETLM